MSNFDMAFEVVLGHEGGFTDHEADTGGPTNLGISLRYLRGRGDLDGDGLPDGDIDGDGDIDVDDIRAMTAIDAKALYHSGFWVPNRCQEIRDQETATKIFDICVNTGSRQAWRIVQRAINYLIKPVGVSGGDPGLVVDGIVGPKTLANINSITETQGEDVTLIGEIRNQQLAFYERLVDKKPDLAVFMNGWRNRAMA